MVPVKASGNTIVIHTKALWFSQYSVWFWSCYTRCMRRKFCRTILVVIKIVFLKFSWAGEVRFETDSFIFWNFFGIIPRSWFWRLVKFGLTSGSGSRTLLKGGLGKDMYGHCDLMALVLKYWIHTIKVYCGIFDLVALITFLYR